MTAPRAHGRWKRRSGSSPGHPPVHEFHTPGGWSARMEKYVHRPGLCYHARVHDPTGQQAASMWIHTNLPDAKLTVEERIAQLQD